jgi:hypothetical protein
MRFRNHFHYLTNKFALLIIFITLFQLNSPVSAAGEANVNVSVSSEKVMPGEAFTVNITIEPDSLVASAQINLSFDPSLVIVNGIIPGDFFNRGGAHTLFTPGIIDNTVGTITGVADRFADPGITASIRGIFAIITMTACSNNGLCALTLNDVYAGDENNEALVVKTVNSQVIINSQTEMTVTTTTAALVNGILPPNGDNSPDPQIVTPPNPTLLTTPNQFSMELPTPNTTTITPTIIENPTPILTSERTSPIQENTQTSTSEGDIRAVVELPMATDNQSSENTPVFHLTLFALSTGIAAFLISAISTFIWERHRNLKKRIGL